MRCNWKVLLAAASQLEMREKMIQRYAEEQLHISFSSFVDDPSIQSCQTDPSSFSHDQKLGKMDFFASRKRKLQNRPNFELTLFVREFSRCFSRPASLNWGRGGFIKLTKGAYEVHKKCNFGRIAEAKLWPFHFLNVECSGLKDISWAASLKLAG